MSNEITHTPSVPNRCHDDAPCAIDELRCACGSLMARVANGRIELKCRRCKRTLLVPIESRDPPPL